MDRSRRKFLKSLWGNLDKRPIIRLQEWWKPRSILRPDTSFPHCRTRLPALLQGLMPEQCPCHVLANHIRGVRLP